MNFTYKFYAIEGLQARKKYYIAMIPLSIISRILVTDSDDVLPEYRAQRKLNELRIPEIKKYILNNRDNYVFSALSASIDGPFEFTKIQGNAGLLEIDMKATILINDGQHRKAAITEALLDDPSLGEETISVVLFVDEGLKKSQQMFTDLNKHAVKTSNSLSTLYDSRNKLAVVTKKMIENNTFFRQYTDKERDILGKNSSKLFTLNSIYKANQRILGLEKISEEYVLFVNNYWQCITDNVYEWQELLAKQITKQELREHYIVTLSVFLVSLGKLGGYFYSNKNIDYEKYVRKMKCIDWSRSNPSWKGRIIRENGSVSNSENSITLLYIELKTILGLDLTKEEINKHQNIRGEL